MTDIQNRIDDFLKERFADAIVSIEDFRGEHTYFIKPEALLEICGALFNEDSLDVKYLSDVTSVDWLGHEDEAGNRFEVIYNFMSLSNQYRFFIKVKLESENPTIKSLTPLFASADWLEREVFDLMGIVFEDHPNLTKILTPDELEGHPLRKDFPRNYEVPQFTWNKDDPPEVIQ